MPAFLLRYWPHLAGLVLVVSVGFALWHGGENAGEAAADARWQAKWEKAEREAAGRLKQAQDRYLAERALRLELLAVSRLIPEPPAPKTLIREVPVDAPVTSCPKLSPDFRLLFNADTTTPAAGAAATGLVSR